MSVRVFLGKINIGISSLSKADCLPQCRWVLFSHLEDWIKQNGKVRDNFLYLTAFKVGHCFSLIWFGLLWFSTFSEFQDCQLPDWNFTISSTRSLACWLQIWRLASLFHHMNQFLVINLCINLYVERYILAFSLENSDYYTMAEPSLLWPFPIIGNLYCS